ncbi:MAG: hypothetical protein HYR85_27100 [Planctomycetes bacterium]|nr:hypothetical protein [Planctomycetota bacterium]
MSSSDAYALSGRPGLAFLLPIVGIASAAISAFVYAWLDVYFPIRGYLSFLFVVWLAFGAATPLMFAGPLFKVRDAATLRVYGVVTGVATVYIAWTFFACILVIESSPDTAPTIWYWIRSPIALWQFARAVAESGWYSFGRGPGSVRPTGIVLWASWAIEAGVVIGTCAWLAPRRIRDRAFCEDCNRWMSDEGDLLLSADDGVTPKTVRKGGLAGIHDVKPPDRNAVHCLRIRRRRCRKCQNAAVYGVDHLLFVNVVKILSPLRALSVRNHPMGRTAESEPVLPLAWQRAAERAELERIAALLHPRAGAISRTPR